MRTSRRASTVASPRKPIAVRRQPSEDDIRWARRVIDRLRGEFARLLEAAPLGSRTSVGLARWLNLKQPLCHRLLAGTRSTDFAVPSSLELAKFFSGFPGIPGLKQILAAARSRDVESSVLTGAAAAVREYGSLIDHFGGSQRRLIEALTPVDDAFEIPSTTATVDPTLSLRRTMHQLHADLLGVQARLTLNIGLYRPCSSQHLFTCGVIGKLGLMRRPGAMPLVASHAFLPKDQGSTDPARVDQPLGSFCTSDIPVVRRVAHGVTQHLFDPDCSLPGPLDLVAGPVRSSQISNPLTSADPRLHCYVALRIPSAWLVKDVFLHRSLAAGSIPSAAALLSHSDLRTPSQFGIAERWPDRIAFEPEVRLLGSGVPSNCPLYERYRELTNTLFQLGDANPDEYVGYRLLVPYPMVGVDYLLAFDFARDDDVRNTWKT
jgi:hypothetical protein